MRNGKEKRQTKEEEEVVRGIEKRGSWDGRKGKRGEMVGDEHRARVLPSAVVWMREWLMTTKRARELEQKRSKGMFSFSYVFLMFFLSHSLQARSPVLNVVDSK